MVAHIDLLDTVALTEDDPELGLTSGEVGAVVQILGDGQAFEVEFCDEEGRTYGLHTLRSEQIVALHNRGRAFRVRAGVA